MRGTGNIIFVASCTELLFGLSHIWLCLYCQKQAHSHLGNVARQCVLHHDGSVGNQLALVHLDDVAPQRLPR